jgi:hypothetical protein
MPFVCPLSLELIRGAGSTLENFNAFTLDLLAHLHTNTFSCLQLQQQDSGAHQLSIFPAEKNAGFFPLGSTGGRSGQQN